MFSPFHKKILVLVSCKETYVFKPKPKPMNMGFFFKIIKMPSHFMVVQNCTDLRRHKSPINPTENRSDSHNSDRIVLWTCLCQLIDETKITNHLFICRIYSNWVPGTGAKTKF